MMGKRRGQICIALLCACIFCFISGCGKREVCEFSHPHRGEVHFSFDWKHLFAGTDMPRRVAVYIYSATRDTLITHFLPNESGVVTLPADNYRFLLYNEDQTSFSIEELHSFHTTAVVHPLQPDGMAASVEPFYTCGLELFTIKPDGNIRYVIVPERFSQRITFSLRVNGLFNPSGCVATLSGLAGSLLLATKENAGDMSPVTAAFPLGINGSQVNGTLYSLGAVNRVRMPNMLTLNFTMPSGLQYSVSVDITEALGKMINGEIDISMLIDGDEVSGIKATVSAWVTGGEVTVVIP